MSLRRCPSLLRAWLCVCSVAGLLACGGPPEWDPSELVDVPHPDLSCVEPVAREQIEERRNRLDEALEGTERRSLADAFGALGEVYHTYDLHEAATASYRNAIRLDEESFLWPYFLGMLAQDQGDTTTARKSLERAVELLPRDAPAQKRLATVLLSLGETETARPLFAALTERDGFRAAGHFGLGEVASTEGDFERAIAEYQKVLELQPAAGLVHHALGLAYRAAGQTDLADEQLAKKGSGEVRAPDRLAERLESLAVTSGAYLRRGSKALVNGDFDRAIEQLRKAIEVDPGNTGAHRNLAHALRQSGDALGALEALKQAEEENPEDVWILFDLGNAYLANGLAERAVETLQKAVELQDDFVQGHFSLANAWIGMERWQEARAPLEKVLALEPDHRRARYLDAITLSRLGKRPRAIRKLQELLAEDPTDSTTRQGLAEIFTENRNLPRAMGLYLEALELEIPEKEKLDYHFQLAELSWRRQRREEAIKWWRRGIELAPDSSQAHTNLANGLQLLGRRKEAIDHFARAVELDPKNATAWLSEGSLWILQKEFATARDRLGEALQHHPDHPGLNNTLARLLATCSDPDVRDGVRSLALARKALAVEGSPDHAETVAMAMAEIGQFEEAIKWQRRLVNQAAANGDQGSLQRLVTRLRLYENRRPLRIAD